jgi:hypothetical protein
LQVTEINVRFYYKYREPKVMKFIQAIRKDEGENLKANTVFSLPAPLSFLYMDKVSLLFRSFLSAV